MTVQIKVKGVPENMNPLANLPASTSKPWTLNGLDLLKLLRMGIVMAVAMLIEYGVPALTGIKWEWNGKDYSALMLVILPIIVDGLRRFVANSGVPVTTTGDVKAAIGANLKELVDEAVRESMAEANKPPPTPEEIVKAEKIAQLRAALAEAEKP